MHTRNKTNSETEPAVDYNSLMNMDWESLESFWKNKHVTGFRRLVYLVSPNETSFKDIKDVPAIRDEVCKIITRPSRIYICLTFTKI